MFATKPKTMFLGAIFGMALLAPSFPASAAEETAVLAGGCFWCVESDLESLKGIKSVVSGYTGGEKKNPTYKDHDDHIEAVKVTFDNSVISYEMLLHAFLRSIDVFDSGGQFCDRGHSYTSAIFYETPQQERIAKEQISLAKKELGGRKIVVPVLPAKPFWVAEDYHQDYYKGDNFVLTRRGPKKQHDAYVFYRVSCGRDARVYQIWGTKAAFAQKYLDK